MVVSQSACWDSMEMLMTEIPRCEKGQSLTIDRCLLIPNSLAPHNFPRNDLPPTPRKMGGNRGIKSNFIEFKYEMTQFA